MLWRPRSRRASRRSNKSLTHGIYLQPVRTIAIAACLGFALVAASAPFASDAAYPGANGRIVFVRQVAGPSPSGVPHRSHALYTIRPDATDERLLLDAVARYPAWSPDGESVVFSNDVDPTNSSRDDWELFVVSADGSRLRQLTFDGTTETSPSWSPDGSQIAFERGGAIWRMRASGVDQRMVVRDALSVAWSPDGRWLGLTRGDGSIEVVHPDGTGRRRVARLEHYSSKFGFGEAVEWTPDSRLALVGPRGLVTMSVDGKVRRLVSRRFNGGYEPAWAPDGRWIAFKSWNPYRLDMLSSDGKRLRLLTRSVEPVTDFSPDWQPLCTRRGTEGQDAIVGTSGADVLCGLGGSDRLEGGAGSDRLFGGRASDRIVARDGAFDVVGCGNGGNDLVIADRRDFVGVDCERVRRF